MMVEVTRTHASGLGRRKYIFKLVLLWPKRAGKMEIRLIRYSEEWRKTEKSRKWVERKKRYPKTMRLCEVPMLSTVAESARRVMFRAVEEAPVRGVPSE